MPTTLHQLLPDWWDFVVDFGADPTGATDCGDAWDAAVAAITANGAGTLYVPAGIYLVSRPLQDTGTDGANAQLPLPYPGDITDSDPTPVDIEPVTMRVVGASMVPGLVGWPANKPTNGYSIFKSTLTGGSGNASVFGSKKLTVTIMMTFENIIVEMPLNPSLTGIDAQWFPAIIRDVMVYAGQYAYTGYYTGGYSPTAPAVEPTHSNQVGIKMSGNNKCDWARCYATVYGCYTGIKQGEALVGGRAGIRNCIVGVEMAAAYHGNQWDRLSISQVQTPIKGTGACTVVINMVDFEDGAGASGAWINPTYQIDDPSNLITGDVKWLRVIPNVGAEHSIDVNGGSNINLTEIGT